jgi:sigma-70-like protein
MQMDHFNRRDNGRDRATELNNSAARAAAGEGPPEEVAAGKGTRKARGTAPVAPSPSARFGDADDSDLLGADEAEDGDDFDDEGEEEGDDGDGDSERVSAAEPPDVSRKVRRRRRRSRPRSKTIAMKRLTREELRVGALLYPPVDIPRPGSRAECSQEIRPCPWVACKHHLYLDVNPETGSIKINFPDLEPWELQHTCALDVADRGGITLEEVGEIMNLTRERIRQVEVRGLLKLKMASPSPEELGAGLLNGDVDGHD